MEGPEKRVDSEHSPHPLIFSEGPLTGKPNPVTLYREKT